MSKTLRVKEEDHAEIKERAERQDKSIKDVMSDMLETDSDDPLTLSEAENAASRSADKLVKHIVLGSCDDSRHERIREELGVSESTGERESGQKPDKGASEDDKEELAAVTGSEGEGNVVGFCPRCGMAIRDSVVSEKIFGPSEYAHDCDGNDLAFPGERSANELMAMPPEKVKQAITGK